MPNVKVGYSQSYDSDTETGVAGDVQRITLFKVQKMYQTQLLVLEGVSGGVFRTGRTGSR